MRTSPISPERAFKTNNQVEITLSEEFRSGYDGVNFLTFRTTWQACSFVPRPIRSFAPGSSDSEAGRKSLTDLVTDWRCLPISFRFPGVR